MGSRAGGVWQGAGPTRTFLNSEFMRLGPLSTASSVLFYSPLGGGMPQEAGSEVSNTSTIPTLSAAYGSGCKLSATLQASQCSPP